MGSQGNGKLRNDEFPMAGGDSAFSYSKISFYQRRVVAASKLPMQEVVAKSLGDQELAAWRSSSSRHNHQNLMISIADMGCSVGPNTFISVQNILEALQLKFEDETRPQFMVFFNDHALNDFNLLFRSLPPKRDYLAAGVPGSFYARVFPDQSLHFVNCSFGLHFLSRVPQPSSSSSDSWNKGKIYYSHSGEDVVGAYSKQYADDMDCFMDARAQEVVPGGLLVFAVPARPDEVPHSQVYFNVLADILGSCLLDLANKGMIDEEEVDSFNVPVYITSPEEVKAAIARNGCFSLEKMEILPKETSPGDDYCKPEDVCSHIRAITEHLIKEKFGASILEPLFELYTKKIEKAHLELSSTQAINLFVALKRKASYC